MTTTKPIRIKSISEYHQALGLPKPEHPLISVINLESVQHQSGNEPISLVFDFYSISLKRNCKAKFKYGQQRYDFDEGVMFFMSPGQVFCIEIEKDVPIRTYRMVITYPSRFLMEYSFGKNHQAIRIL